MTKDGKNQEPATRGDLQEVRSVLKDEIQEVRSELKNEIQEVRSELKNEIQEVRTELKSDISEVRSELLAFIKAEGEKTRQHFDVVAENIHKDVAAANKDELSLIKAQQLPDHETRIQKLEKHAELPVGPRHATSV